MDFSLLQTIIPSRQNSTAVQIAVAVLVCLALIITVKQIYTSTITKIRDKAKKTASKKLDVKELQKLAERLVLTKQEISFLIKHCKQNNITDVPLIANTEYCITTIFKQIYDKICVNAENLSNKEFEVQKLELFMLINKIEESKRNLSFLTSTISFTEGLPISYVTEDGEHHISHIIENNKIGLFLQVALNQKGELVKPKPLSRIELFFELQGGIVYKIATQVIRYQYRQGITELVVTHSNDIEFFQRRRFKRRAVSLDCYFNAVKVQKNNVDKTLYDIQEKKYTGQICNISASGCLLKTNIPIRAEQYMNIQTQLPNGKEVNMIGLIVLSRKERDKNLCVINIRFVKMSISTKNALFELIYDYDKKIKAETT